MNQANDHTHNGVARTLALATGLTLGYAAVEAGVGVCAGSLALVADAGHMVGAERLRRLVTPLKTTDLPVSASIMSGTPG